MISVDSTVFIFLVVSLIPRSSLSHVTPGHEDIEPITKISYRLPNNTFPRLYIINLEPHIDDVKFTFDGTSSTLFEVIIPTQNVIVHASKLIEIDKTYTRLICSGGTILQPISQKWNSTLDFLTLEFDRILDIGNYSIKFKWKGYNGADQFGFFRAYYKTTDQNHNEIIEYLAATEFEATGARSAFPCWDEPGLKAQFEISLKHYTNHTALSNMPVKNVVVAEDGKVWTSFHKTPLMSTYFVAFVVATYTQYVNAYRNITMWAPNSDFENAQFSFNLSLEVIPVMEKYTGIPYSLPKMDQAMIPQYESGGATEHWGLISYGPDILFKPGYDDIDKKNGAAAYIAHEIAHQWFGNLVTPQWWDDLWLSEAFATYFHHIILDEVLDNWNAVNLLDTKTRNRASFPSGEEDEEVYPIKWMPETPEEIEIMFGSVTYMKGAAVVEMLAHILTEKVFQNGIRRYLNRHQYGSVVADDLWQALQETYSAEELSPDLNIKEIMNPWIEQTGYPLVNVTKDYETGIITVTQMNVRSTEPENSWMIPINYATSSEPNFTSTRATHWLPRFNEILKINDVPKDDWIVLNIQNKGFYRVNYDWENWKRLANYLNSDNYEKIHIINRSQLLHDIIYLAQRETRYFELAIDMVSYLHRETNYLPWSAVIQIIQDHLIYFMNTPHYEDISKWMLHLMDNIIDKIGFDDNANDDHLSSLARKELLGLACAFGHKDCRIAATSKLTEILTTQSINSFPRYSHDRIYCPGLIEANETIWDLMMEAHFANPKEEPGFDYLGCTNNRTLIEKYFNLLLTRNGTFPKNDILFAFVSLTEDTRDNIDLALDIFIEKYEAIKKYGGNSTDDGKFVNAIIQRLGKVITTDNQYEKLTKFLSTQEAEGKMKDYGNGALKAAKKNMAKSKKISELIDSLLEKRILNNLKAKT